MEAIEVAVVRRFADLAADALAEHREEIDALNVYPVADSDTGTNLYLTACAARDALRESGAADGPSAMAAYARGALLGARGNSGVILSQMLGASLRRIAGAAPEERHARVFADALALAEEASYAAVGVPVEGTMLSVCRAAAEAAAKVAGEPRVRTRDVLAAATGAAHEALDRTPEQLQVLADTGVVDAGGQGLCVLLDAFETALTGRRPVPSAPRPPAHVAMVSHNEPRADGPSYEVMYLLDAEESAIPDLRHTLGGLGDSLVLVGGEGLWNVHVHVDDVGAAIEAGLEAGRPHRIRVTHFDQQADAPADAPRAERRVVAVAAGPGLAALFREAGASVVEISPERRATSRELLEAILACAATEVVILPNDPVSRERAEVAARTAEADHAIRVVVLPTIAQVQGLASLAVHEPGRSLGRDIVEMTAAARHVRHGAVTTASRRAITMAGPCEPGDALGIVDGDFVRVGGTQAEVALDVLQRLLGAGGELVTLVSGAEDPTGELAAACARWVESTHPTVGAVVYDGGQERYPLLLSVE